MKRILNNILLLLLFAILLLFIGEQKELKPESNHYSVPMDQFYMEHEEMHVNEFMAGVTRRFTETVYFVIKLLNIWISIFVIEKIQKEFYELPLPTGIKCWVQLPRGTNPNKCFIFT